MSSSIFCPTELSLPASLSASIPADAVSSTANEAWTYAAAHAYCRHLATTHYENFHVGTWLLPKPVREHAYNVYAYCRWSDDLADETGDTETSLRLLEWWLGELDRLYAGKARHPVFVALAHTVETFALPRKLFADLVDAFIQDQKVFRYETYADVLDYCTRSADPVGRLVLSLLGYTDDVRFRLSDKTCTALQLANHWQDVENDWRRGRVYLPLEDMRRFGVTEDDIAERRATPSFRKLMAFEVDRAQKLFEEGLPLIGMVKGRARFDIDLFSRGGLAVLDAIRALDFDVLTKRPVITKGKRLRLLLGTLTRGLFSRRPAS